MCTPRQKPDSARLSRACPLRRIQRQGSKTTYHWLSRPTTLSSLSSTGMSSDLFIHVSNLVPVHTIITNEPSPVSLEYQLVTYHISHQRGILPSSMASPPADHASTELNVWPPCLLHHVLPFFVWHQQDFGIAFLHPWRGNHQTLMPFNQIEKRSKSVNYPALLLSRRSTSSS